MSGVQLTLFDIIAIVVVGLSALAAMMRGAVREILALASWIGAAIVAFLALPYAARWSDRWWPATRSPTGWLRSRCSWWRWSC